MNRDDILALAAAKPAKANDEIDQLSDVELASMFEQLWPLVQDLVALRQRAGAKLCARIGTGKVTTSSGAIVRGVPKHKARTGWNNPALSEALADTLGRPFVDPDTGEHVHAVPAAELGAWTPMHGIRRLRKLGLDPDAFCQVEDKPSVKLDTRPTA